MPKLAHDVFHRGLQLLTPWRTELNVTFRPGFTHFYTTLDADEAEDLRRCPDDDEGVQRSDDAADPAALEPRRLWRRPPSPSPASQWPS